MGLKENNDIIASFFNFESAHFTEGVDVFVVANVYELRILIISDIHSSSAFTFYLTVRFAKGIYTLTYVKVLIHSHRLHLPWGTF